MKLEEYPFKLSPDPHQLKYLQEHAQDKAFGLLWQMGVAKSKAVIDNACLLYKQGKINGVLIVAPTGVDLNWLLEELPKHIPDSIRKESRIFRFSSKKAKTKASKEECKWIQEHWGLSWLILNYDAFMTMDGKEVALSFCDKREVFYILDESSVIKTPKAKRTQRIVRTAWRAKYRRILEGTPITNGAIDIYKQVEFLDPTFWKRHGWDSPLAFKTYFHEYADKPQTYWYRDKTTGTMKKTEVQVCVGYKNLEELNRLIQPITSRLLKKDVLNLPPKIYEPRYFELSREQRELYDKLAKEFCIELEKDEGVITAPLAIVRMLRLHQISCGYVPIETEDPEDEPLYVIPGQNPRLNALEDLIDTITTPTIIWCKYRLDMKLIKEVFKRKANRCKVAVYDAQESEEAKLKAKQDFQEGRVDWLLTTQSAMSRGHTLHRAENCIYYSNGMNLAMRQQSEDRAHRRGVEHPVTYIDLLGENTIDKRIMLNLCSKMDTSDAILGDIPGVDMRQALREWLYEDNRLS